MRISPVFVLAKETAGTGLFRKHVFMRGYVVAQERKLYETTTPFYSQFSIRKDIYGMESNNNQTRSRTIRTENSQRKTRRGKGSWEGMCGRAKHRYVPRSSALGSSKPLTILLPLTASLLRAERNELNIAISPCVPVSSFYPSRDP